MLERIPSYFHDDEFHFTVYENKLYVIHFQQILILEEYFISFRSVNTVVSIHGKNLVLIKLLDDEMLIEGDIIKIEVRHD